MHSSPFLPGGARLWGRVSVGVRCNTGQPWTRYVPAYVAVHGNYYVAARPLSAGQVLTPADATVREGDLTALPRGVVVDAAQFDGVTALNSIASGAPLRRESLRAAIAVQQGQNVRLRARGAGFTVSTEGKAMASAAAGPWSRSRRPAASWSAASPWPTARWNGCAEFHFFFK